MKLGNHKLKKTVYIMFIVSILILIALMISMLIIMGKDANKHLIAASIFSIFLVIFMFVNLLYFFLYNKKKSVELQKEKAKNDELFLSEVEYKVATKKTNVLVLRYDIKARILYVRINSITSYEPRVVTNFPESAIEGGLISKNSTGAFINFFQKMRDGIESAECIVEIKNVATNDFMLRTIHYTLIRDENGNPAYGIIDVNKEETAGNIDYYSLNEDFKNIDERKKLFLEYDITTGVCTRKEGKLKTALNGDISVSYFDNINNFGNSIVHEKDRKLFLESLKRDKMITSFYDKKVISSFDYQENVGNDVYRWRHMDIRTYKAQNCNDIFLCLFIMDIDEIKREEISIKKLTEEDHLTQLYNRSTFTSMVKAAIDEHKDSIHAIIILDIDNFKAINDTYGHFSGDQVLMDVAKRLSSIVRTDDIISRFGGDEFMIFLKNVSYEAVVMKKAQQICDILRIKISNKKNDSGTISASMGIAMYPKDGKDFDALYKHSDAALYTSKRHGKDRFSFYKSTMDDGYVNQSTEIEDIVVTSEVSINDIKIKKHMLIVDDDKLNRELLGEMFKNNYILHYACNGEDALVNLSKYASSLSVVLLDIIMPIMDGYEVIRQMNINPRYKSIPVIVISVLDDMTSNLRAVSLGATDFVSKPFEPVLVKMRVESAIMKYENEQMRAQNDFLLLQSMEEARYVNLLECTKTVVFEYDCINQVFIYDNRTNNYLKGIYDNRPLWDIWFTDMVTTKENIDILKTVIDDFTNNTNKLEYKMSLKLNDFNNNEKWFSLEIYRLIHAGSFTSKIIITLRNIENEVISNEKLRKVLECDDLTGINNRKAFLKKAFEKITTRIPSTYKLAYFDIANFNVFNDLYGHNEGDKLLQFIGKTLNEEIGEKALFCRISSDDFAILYEINEENNLIIEKVSQKIMSKNYLKFHIVLKWGIYTIDNPNLSIDTMLDCAEIAHKLVKKQSGLNVLYYDEKMEHDLVQERIVVSEMENALEKGEFEVYLQPQYNYKLAKIDGAEALVRWNHPKRGVLLPGEFIPIFEKNGFVSTLDAYVRRQVCILIRKMLDDGIMIIPISVNLSRIDIYDSTLISGIIELVKEFNIDPKLLHIEITESAYIKDFDQLNMIVNELRKNGFIVEMDDFGRGYSSLNSLGNMQVDVVKLDMEFINNAQNDKKRLLIIENIIKMVNNINVSVIAEGVSEKKQAELLSEMGCERMQGFLFYRPMKMKDFLSILKKKERDS